MWLRSSHCQRNAERQRIVPALIEMCGMMKANLVGLRPSLVNALDGPPGLALADTALRGAGGCYGGAGRALVAGWVVGAGALYDR